jgi:DnaK suppressor protein
MSKSKPVSKPVDASSDRKPGKASAKKAAPLAAKAGSGTGESKPDSRSVKTDDEKTGNVKKTAVSKVSEVATKTSKSTSTASGEPALLTEEQILKMSDKDYMNAAQLAFFKVRLQQLEIDLLKNAGETTEHLRETVLVPDPADRATIEEEHALELRTRDRERKLLKKVQQSLASIEAGEYGWCEETGEPIGIPRLLARPTATLSLEAQQRRELKQKLYGD